MEILETQLRIVKSLLILPRGLTIHRSVIGMLLLRLVLWLLLLLWERRDTFDEVVLDIYVVFRITLTISSFIFVLGLLGAFFPLFFFVVFHLGVVLVKFFTQPSHKIFVNFF